MCSRGQLRGLQADRRTFQLQPLALADPDDSGRSMPMVLSGLVAIRGRHPASRLPSGGETTSRRTQ
jgi:hypothetical protein